MFAAESRSARFSGARKGSYGKLAAKYFLMLWIVKSIQFLLRNNNYNWLFHIDKYNKKAHSVVGFFVIFYALEVHRKTVVRLLLECCNGSLKNIHSKEISEFSWIQQV